MAEGKGCRDVIAGPKRMGAPVTGWGTTKREWRLAKVWRLIPHRHTWTSNFYALVLSARLAGRSNRRFRRCTRCWRMQMQEGVYDTNSTKAGGWVWCRKGCSSTGTECRSPKPDDAGSTPVTPAHG